MAEKKLPPICSRPELLAHTLSIMEEYRQDGLSLTLRQMYYQCVARGLLRNGQKHYKRIGDVLTKARYEGTFPLDGRVDRGRSIHPSDSTRNDESVSAALTAAHQWVESLPAFLMQSARWFRQPIYVSCWVEKEALAEVFEQTCSELGIGWFACRGYPSVSALYAFLRELRSACESEEPQTRRFSLGGSHAWSENHRGHAEEVVVLYFGDHDPDGWQIPRSAEKDLGRLQRLLGTDYKITFRRIGLNMDQILRFNPPPFPAKPSSTRFAKYQAEHGTTDAWELDALEPRVLRTLITENVEAMFDEQIYNENQALITERQDELWTAMTSRNFWGGF